MGRQARPRQGQVIMRSREPSTALPDFFTTEVQLFRADVDLASRSTLCTPLSSPIPSHDGGCLPTAGPVLPPSSDVAGVPQFGLPDGF